MKYIIRKYVNAESAKEALSLDRKTPVHDLYLKDGEEPKQQSFTHAVGYHMPAPDDSVPYELRDSKRRRMPGK